VNAPPPGPWNGPPPPYPPARSGRKKAAIVVGAAVVVLAGLIVATVVLSPHTSAPTGEWKAGQCVTPAGRAGDQDGTKFRRTGCDAKDAAAKVIKMTSEGFFGAPVQCPDETDALVKIEQDREHLNLAENVACIRNLSAPHPGDVGQGGGMVRAGDCVPDPGEDSDVNEVPCAGAHWGTVVRWAGDAASCPKGNGYDAIRMLTSKRALCVRKS
jgi:hypothetical protein